MAIDNSISRDIFNSRDKTREQIIQFAKEYLELENIDLTKSSFLTFIIDIMSTLTSNIMFYQTNIYKEFFLTQAQLPESIHNLSSFLGYSPKNANFATANVLLTIPFGFSDPNTVFIIDENFIFSTNDNIEFTTYYKTTIKISNNSAVSIKLEDNQDRIYNIPSVLTTIDGVPSFQFVLPIRQYKISRQEFQIESDLELYQFTEIEVPFTKKLSSLTVYVRDPSDSIDSTGELYTEATSVYLMSSSTKGYVSRKSIGGRTIFFGNGLMGNQPPAGGTVIVDIRETLGKSGNVIKGSIIKGQRIYSIQNGNSTIVDYTVTNSSPAFGGEDEESLQDIKNNSIQSLTSMKRLVTDNDFTNAKAILSNSPITANSIPILKRSDLKINEIQLFISLEFGGEIVPSRNIFHEVSLGTTYIPRGTIINIDSIDYITIFEINIESINSSAKYSYLVTSVDTVPILNQSWNHPDQDNYHFHGQQVTMTRIGNGAKVDFTYQSLESDFSNLSCTLRIETNDTIYNMTNIPGTNGGVFTYSFADYNDIPDDIINMFFRVSNSNLPLQTTIAEYSNSVTFRQDLSLFMLSNVVDSTSTIIYDIPVIQKTYYDNLTSQSDFELNVIQKLLTSMDLINFRMLTDFINIKFCNTTGKLKSMLDNKTTKRSVLSMGINTLPVSGSDGDRYTISSEASGPLANQRFNIAELLDSTAMVWTYITPTTNDTLISTDTNTKYIYSPSGWINPIYDIPLQISLEVFIDPLSSVTEAGLIQDIKTTLVEKFQDDFGPNIIIYRADIIETVQNLSGVLNCRLIKPETSIFFNFVIDDMLQQQLLEYSPEWVFFTEDDISIKLLASD